MSRTHWLAALGIICVGVGVALRLRWPSAAPGLDCPVESVRWMDAVTMWVASCTSGTAAGRPPAGPMLTLGARLNLNDATAEELALIPGIGPTLARALVKERGELGYFRSWEEVDAVSGVGPTKLDILKRSTELR